MKLRAKQENVDEKNTKKNKKIRKHSVLLDCTQITLNF